MTAAAGHRQRLRARFQQHATDLTDSDRLELLLTYALPRRDVRPLAESLLQQFGGLEAALTAPLAELVARPGLGEYGATLLQLVGHIAAGAGNESHAADSPETAAQTDMHQQLPLLPAFEAAQPPVDAAPPKMTAYVNDEIEPALALVPRAAEFDSYAAYRRFLNDHMPYNSASTRQRRANHLLGRFFAQEQINTPLRYFIQQIGADAAALKAALFYHILRAEPMAAAVAEECVWPALAHGYVEREELLAFILRLMPDLSASSQKNALRSLFRTYHLLDVGQAQDSRLYIQARSGTLAGFLYILSCQYPQPGIVTFDELDKSPVRHWLLWDREWLRRQLYNLRDLGIISKISEIDTVRQFALAQHQADALHTYFQALRHGQPALREQAA